jgi:hypothetical protein
MVEGFPKNSIKYVVLVPRLRLGTPERRLRLPLSWQLSDVLVPRLRLGTPERRLRLPLSWQLSDFTRARGG